jgi:hypothetical protein
MARIAIVFAMGALLVCCGGSPSGGADAAVAGDGPQAAAGKRSCATMPVLCDLISANDAATIFTGPMPTVVPNDNVLPGARCGWERDHPPLSVTVTYNCYTEVLSTAQETFGELRMLAMNDMFEGVSGLGDEAYWTYTNTSTLSFVSGALYVRAANVIVAVSQYSQYNEDASGMSQAIDPATAKARALAMVQKLMAATGL